MVQGVFPHYFTVTYQDSVVTLRVNINLIIIGHVTI